MQQEVAQKIIGDTFEQPFNREQFARFVGNLLVRLEPASFARPLGTQEIFPEFRRYINSYDRFGKYEDSEGNKIDVLIVNLNADRSLERARSAQRNFVAKYLKSGQLKDAALVAFVSPGEQDWRFSLVRMAYRYDSDRNKVIEELSPAKRYSFLVGANENSHTAQSRLLSVLTNGEPTLKDLENAFAVDPVTKEFFKQYRNLFDKLSAILKKNKSFVIVATRNNLDIENFAKKLLGQIVFLYFLQKKGWLGVPKGKTWGDGDRGFLRALFSRCVEKNENFYNDYLEILFYDTLNNPRSRQADRNYSQHFESKIPFLNGGLFEPDYDWERTTIHLENDIFGDILEVFDRFNFTVKEDEPLEREVAVDPEMLGKVFENLLSENLRKGHGTYYTPREIVHYMCQESLIGYLTERSGLPYEGLREFIQHPVMSAEELAQDIRDNKERIDKLLAEVRVLDPACGSGAFLVGMLQEIVRARQSLRPRLTDYRMKKTAIQDCIYGVDIDPGAVDIAKLRLWLSLVVDYDLEDIEPLPNLDYKIMQGNSLLEEFEGVRFYDGEDVKQSNTLFVDEEQARKKQLLREMKREYFSTSDDKAKAVLRGKINELIDWFVSRAVHDELRRVKSLRKAKEREGELLKRKDREKHWQQWASKFAKEEALNNLLRIIHDPKGVRPFFLWKLNFMEVFDEKDGFDIVIANPPYGLLNKKQNQQFGHIATPEEIQFYKQSSKYQPALGGMINVFRLFIVQSIDLLREKGFFVEIFPLAFTGDISASRLRTHILNRYGIVGIDAFPERDNEKKRIFEGAKMSVCILYLTKAPSSDPFFIRINNDRYVDQKNPLVRMSRQDIEAIDPAHSTIPLLLERDFKLITKIYQQSQLLSSIGHCFTGEVDLTLGKKYLSDNKDDAAFIKGAIIDRYTIRSQMSQGQIQFLKKNLYLKHNSGKKVLHYKASRIVMQAITGVNEKVRLKMTLIEPEVFCGNSVNYIVLDSNSVDEKFLLGLLNSRLLNYVFTKFSTNSNVNGYEVDNLPIRVPSMETQRDTASIVERIMSEKNRPAKRQSDTETPSVIELERAVDDFVYRLYELTPEEIAIVEGETRSTNHH